MPYIKVEDESGGALVPALSLGYSVVEIKLNDLEVGDILVWSANSSSLNKTHKLIREGSEGIYSHVGIYIGDGNSIDAGPSGVKEYAISELVSNFRVGIVMRLTNAPTFPIKAAKVATTMLDYKYSYQYALLQPFRKKLYMHKLYRLIKREKRLSFGLMLGSLSIFLKKCGLYKNKTFCSQLIVDSYHGAGYDFNGYFEYSCLSPEDILQESIFSPVGYLTNEHSFTPEIFDSLLSSGGEVLRLPKMSFFDIVKTILSK